MEFLLPASVLILFIFNLALFLLFLWKKLIRNKETNDLKNTQKILSALWKIQQLILQSLEFEEVVQKIANAVLVELGKYGYVIIVLSLKDEERGVLRRISISETEQARKALQFAPIPFSQIEIPLNANENIGIRALNENKMLTTNYLSELLTPLVPKHLSDKAQKSAGIKASTVFPIYSKESAKAVGILIFSVSKEADKITSYEKEIMKGFADAVGIAIQNSRLYSILAETKKKLEQANIRLKELDKLKDDFVSVASHELRTPMTAIKSYLWVAMNKRNAELSEDMKRYLSRAYISVERLINLVNDMLNISRIESGRIALKLSEVDLNDLTKEVVEEVSVKAQERGIRVIGLNKQIPKVLCDQDKIHEVFLNLIGNSLKFTKTGGTITVDFYEKYPYVYTSVRDTGVGIEPENLSKLFAKFGRLENSYVAVAESGGTGLGLFITKSIVNLHKGQVTAESEGLDKGSTFTFSLPIIGTDIAAKLKDEAPKETDETKDLEKTSANFV